MTKVWGRKYTKHTLRGKNRIVVEKDQRHVRDHQDGRRECREGDEDKRQDTFYKQGILNDVKYSQEKNKI